MDRRPAAAVVAAGVLLAPAAPALAAEAPQVPGLVVYASEFDVDQTTRRVEEALAEAGMVTATLDHRANAASVGAELRPTTLVIGGAPQAGTPLLLADQAVGIDLPQKFLAWQDEDGDVWLGYNSAEYVAARAGIDTGAGALSGLRDGTARLAAAATGSESPEALGSRRPATAPTGSSSRATPRSRSPSPGTTRPSRPPVSRRWRPWTTPPGRRPSGSSCARPR